MKINWKNRFRNKVTLLTGIGAIIYIVFKIECLFGMQPDAAQYQALYDIFGALITLGCLFGIITDPNTPGLTDGGEHKDGRS